MAQGYLRPFLLQAQGGCLFMGHVAVDMLCAWGKGGGSVDTADMGDVCLPLSRQGSLIKTQSGLEPFNGYSLYEE